MGAPLHYHSKIESEQGRSVLWVRASGRDVDDAWATVRAAMSVEAVARLGEQQGFRIEDVEWLSIEGEDPEADVRWARRRVPPECVIVTTASSSRAITARIGRRGDSGLTQRKTYARGPDQRIRVEALEFHVAEHCNLRCAHCCNMSPFVDERFLDLCEVQALATRMASTFEVDVFKIMGGEPLLHPQITEVLRILRASKVSPIIRLFTNGLLLHRMDTAFWEALDQLTISVYDSAPVKPSFLEDARRLAKQHDVVLNIKPVSEFSRVLREDAVKSDEQVRSTYDACWLRHRCLIVREGVFFKCTRAAYFRDFMARLHAQPVCPPDPNDGVALDAVDFDERLLAYLNRTDPLTACRYCHGGDGPREAHVQLRKKDVAQGHLGPPRDRS